MVLVDKSVEGHLSMSVVVLGGTVEFESLRVSSFLATVFLRATERG